MKATSKNISRDYGNELTLLLMLAFSSLGVYLLDLTERELTPLILLLAAGFLFLSGILMSKKHKETNPVVKRTSNAIGYIMASTSIIVFLACLWSFL